MVIIVASSTDINGERKGKLTDPSCMRGIAICPFFLEFELEEVEEKLISEANSLTSGLKLPSISSTKIMGCLLLAYWAERVDKFIKKADALLLLILVLVLALELLLVLLLSLVLLL